MDMEGGAGIMKTLIAAALICACAQLLGCSLDKKCDTGIKRGCPCGTDQPAGRQTCLGSDEGWSECVCDGGVDGGDSDADSDSDSDSDSDTITDGGPG